MVELKRNLKDRGTLWLRDNGNILERFGFATYLMRETGFIVTNVVEG